MNVAISGIQDSPTVVFETVSWCGMLERVVFVSDEIKIILDPSLFSDQQRIILLRSHLYEQIDNLHSL